MKADEGVKACERRLVENKVTIKETQKKFSELMTHNDNLRFKGLENEIKKLNRLNSINDKMVKETRQLRKQRSKVFIRKADGSSEAVLFNF